MNKEKERTILVPVGLWWRLMTPSEFRIYVVVMPILWLATMIGSGIAYYIIEM